MTNRRRRLAFVTYSGRPHLTEDDRLAAEALARRGWSVHAHPWDLPGSIDPFAATIVRSTWNYHRQPDAFRDWLREQDQRDTPLWNSPELLAWNSDKSLYLPELARQGVRIPDSLFLPKESPVSLAEAMERKGWRRGAVLKPSTSASAYCTAWVPSIEQATRFQPLFSDLLLTSGVVLQPFLPEVRDGEWSLIFFNDGAAHSSGRFSHSVLKVPAPGEFRVQGGHGGTARGEAVPPALVEAARTITRRIPHRWLYARVDGIVQQGELCLMELELIEPCLFFSQAPGAAERFADAVESTLLARPALFSTRPSSG